MTDTEQEFEKILEQIDQEIKNNEIILFMKGTEDFPLCGFSGTVVNILQKLGATFKTVNVLENEKIRQAIKRYSNWPTIPQLYIRGEFVGGCDIAKEMYDSGELQQLLGSH